MCNLVIVIYNIHNKYQISFLYFLFIFEYILKNIIILIKRQISNFYYLLCAIGYILDLHILQLISYNISHNVATNLNYSFSTMIFITYFFVI